MSEAGGTARRLKWGLAGGWLGGEPHAPEALATVIPGLRVLALAGRGGMGVVYRAEQTRLGRVVALKILPAVSEAEPFARERFEREARVLAGIDHARVLRVFEFGALPDGTPYLVTEWAEGGDLARRLAGRPHPLGEATFWVAQIAEALDAAHARGVVHRDLKPANVLVRADGGLALGDFGVALARGPGFTTELTLSGAAFGTADYMAPEQCAAAGEITPAADVYALGVMTYQMLTGSLPRGMFEPVSTLVGAPAAVDDLIASALAADPARRPASAGDFARRLAAAGGFRPAIWPRAALAGLVAVTLAGLAFGWSRRAAPEPASPAAVSAPASAIPDAEDGWRALLPAVSPARDAVRGVWTAEGGELAVDGGGGVLRLPEAPSPDFNYDLRLEFTRLDGRHSAGVFLPTAAGTGVFELDAWEAGLGGLQLIDGRDLRAHGLAIPAILRNGERQRLILRVRGARVTVERGGRRAGEWDLTGRRLSVPLIWEAGPGMGFGLCAWKSRTVFHRVELRTP